MMALSEKEAAILVAIERSHEERGIPPTLKEIAAEVGIKSMGMLHDSLVRLEKMGYVRRTPNIARSLVLLEKA